VADVELPDEVDVVVIGAGHNALVCAGYLAVAGLEVAVLEASEGPGGNTRTEELTLPGFAHDSCSSAHVLVQSNPLVADDELGLLSRYGLEYVLTDPAVVLPQRDGDSLVVHRDLEATVAEVARWSTDDAAAFRAMVQEWTGGLGAVHARWSSALPLTGGGGDTGAVSAYLALRERSAWDVVHERFHHPVVRSAVLWLAMATIQDPRRPGTGFLPSSLTVGRLSHGWATPRGGSQALPDALVRLVEDHGGSVHCGAEVAGVDARHGRARSVRTIDGRTVRVRRAVVSSAHLGVLAEMVDAPDVPEDLATARRQWQPGLSVFAVHAALRGDLVFQHDGSAVQSAAAGLGTTTGMARQVDAHARGETEAADPWLLVVDQTVVDPVRAPDGAATLKLLTVAPYTRSDGRDWADAKDEYAAALLGLVRERATGLADADVLAVRAESPVDVARHNPHNLGGSCHGGEFLLDDGTVVAGWPEYRTSVPGLYVTGATVHPGGSVSGRPGRNAARVVLTDLGHDPGRVMGPR
jgi:phytoene dehydrogenase-like protein